MTHERCWVRGIHSTKCPCLPIESLHYPVCRKWRFCSLKVGKEAFAFVSQPCAMLSLRWCFQTALPLMPCVGGLTRPEGQMAMHHQELGTWTRFVMICTKHTSKESQSFFFLKSRKLFWFWWPYLASIYFERWLPFAPCFKAFQPCLLYRVTTDTHESRWNTPIVVRSDPRTPQRWAQIPLVWPTVTILSQSQPTQAHWPVACWVHAAYR